MSSADLVREAQDPSTSAARLAELAQADRATWTAIVFHPAAYDGLLQWLGERGDPTVSAALSARSAQVAAQAPAAPPAPEQPPVPPDAPPAAEAPAQPEPEPEVAPEPVSPVAEPVIAPSAVEEPSPVESPVAESPVHEPTVVIPPQHETAQQPVHETAQQPVHEPTAVFATPPTYPPAATPAAGFGSVPPGGDGTTTGSTGAATTGKSLAVVIGAVVVIVALVAGAAFAASKVFGGDDDDPSISVSDSETTKTPEPSDEPSDEPSSPSLTLPPPSGDGASSEFCTTLNDVQQQSLDMLGGDSSDPDELQAKGQRLISAYEDLEDIAPADVSGDIRTMIDYLETSMDPSTLGQGDISAYSAAARKIGVYYAGNCL